MVEFDLQKNDRAESVKNGIYYGTLVLCGVTIIFSAYGFCILNSKGCKSLLIYAIFSFLATFFFITLGLGLLLFTVGSKNYLDQYCSKSPFDKISGKLEPYAFSYVPTMDQQLPKLIDQYMCKADCPCSPQVQSQMTNIPKSNFLFNGQINNFQECYQKLVNSNKIKPLSDNFLNILKKYEKEGKCQSVC